MGVIEQVLRSGNSIDEPKKGDTITAKYTCCFFDDSVADNNGQAVLYTLNILSCHTDTDREDRLDTFAAPPAFETSSGCRQDQQRLIGLYCTETIPTMFRLG